MVFGSIQGISRLGSQCKFQIFALFSRRHIRGPKRSSNIAAPYDFARNFSSNISTLRQKNSYRGLDSEKIYNPKIMQGQWTCNREKMLTLIYIPFVETPFAALCRPNCLPLSPFVVPYGNYKFSLANVTLEILKYYLQHLNANALVKLTHLST